MGDNFANFNRDGGSDFNEMHSRFSIPPPNFQGPQGNANKNPRQWEDSYQEEDFTSNWNSGANREVKGSRDNQNKQNFRRDGRGMGNGGGNKDGYNKGYGGGSDMVIQEDTIFVSGMDPSITEQDINNHFGSIGIIKKDKKTQKPKIWLYKHKESGVSKGEATVTYDDVNAAKSAISWFDGRDFNGSTVKVSLAQRQNTWNKSGNRGGFGGGSRGGSKIPSGEDRVFQREFDRKSGSGRDDRTGRPNGGGSSGGSGNAGSGQAGNNRGSGGSGGNLSQREGDWKCADCKNTNFSWRNECNRCKVPKREIPSFDTSQSDFSDGRRSNFKNTNRGGMQSNFPQRGDMERSSNNVGSDFSGRFNNRRDGGPVRNAGGDREGRMRPY